MSNDHDFEQVLSARLRSAAEPVTGAGVTPERVEARVAERRAGRRRRQGLVAIAAAAIVVLGGVGLSAAVDRDTPSRVASEGDPSTTEQPTTDPCAGTTLPPSTSTVTTLPPSTSTLPADVEGTGPSTTTTRPAPDEPCAPGTTEPPTTSSPDTTSPETATTEPSTTPSTLPPPETEPPGTTQPAAYPGAACTPGSHADCIDPEGDGTFVWLIGGADCMASPIGGAMCADLDGDGHAGYPDSEG